MISEATKKREILFVFQRALINAGLSQNIVDKLPCDDLIKALTSEFYWNFQTSNASDFDKARDDFYDFVLESVSIFKKTPELDEYPYHQIIFKNEDFVMVYH